MLTSVSTSRHHGGGDGVSASRPDRGGVGEASASASRVRIERARRVEKNTMVILSVVGVRTGWDKFTKSNLEYSLGFIRLRHGQVHLSIQTYVNEHCATGTFDSPTNAQ